MKPILFNTEMVRAILEERKSVTRRAALKSDELRSFPCSAYPDGWWFRGRVYASKEKAMCSVEGVMRLCEYRQGDILWVRETWAEMPYGIVYRADGEEPEGWDQDDRWRPSIHMPKKAARLFLRVTDVRVELLQDITDYRSEGIHPSEACEACFAVCGGCDPLNSPTGCDNEIEAFANLWDRTIKPAGLPLYGWEANPWVWVIEFERISKDEALGGGGDDCTDAH